MTQDQFRSALVSLNWNMQDFADRAGVQRQTVSRWANAHVEVPKWAELLLNTLLQVQRIHERLIERELYT